MPVHLPACLFSGYDRPTAQHLEGVKPGDQLVVLDYDTMRFNLSLGPVRRFDTYTVEAHEGHQGRTIHGDTVPAGLPPEQDGVDYLRLRGPKGKIRELMYGMYGSEYVSSPGPFYVLSKTQPERLTYIHFKDKAGQPVTVDLRGGVPDLALSHQTARGTEVDTPIRFKADFPFATLLKQLVPRFLNWI
jgi:hypothetical protein